MPIIDHLNLNVTDYARAKRFYDQALAPLGIRLVMEFGGFGRERPEFWIAAGATSYQTPAQIKPITPVHVAFAARDRGEVDAFHAAALAAGGTDFGAPGLRPEYHPNYYGAFVRDPDGHNVEAVCRQPSPPTL